MYILATFPGCTPWRTRAIGNSTKELTLPSLSDTVSAFGLAVSLPSQQPSIVPGRRARRLVIVEQLF